MKPILRVFIILVPLLFLNTLQAQKAMRSFKGRVVDSATQMPIKDVSVCIYRASDTSLINFGFTTPNGNFTLGTTSRDSLIIIFSIVGFSEKIKRNKEIDNDWSYYNFGDIKLAALPFTLSAVSARTSAIRMKGDTMEINAGRFKVMPGSDVAQLFKKIPGFEVNVKGEIKVGGVSVEKIMVDGSDFFGNNPGMVSKNLTADMIETVQVFEEKNPDGSPKNEQTKIINLKLKKGKRNGTYGDILAGYGSTGRYESGLRLNSFKNDRKVSFIANSNNINQTGFDFGFDNWHGAQNDERNGTANNNYFYSSSGNNANNEGNINNHFQSGITFFNEFSKKRKFSFNVFAERNKFSSISASNTSNPLNDSVRRFNIDSNVLNGLAYSTFAEVDYTRMRDSTLKLEAGIRTSVDLNTVHTNKDNIIRFNSKEVNRGFNTLKDELMNNYFRATGYAERRWRKDIRYRSSISGNFRNYLDNNYNYQYLSNTSDTFNNKTGQKINRQEYLIKVTGQMPIYKFWSLNLTADRWLQINRNNRLTNGTTPGATNFTSDYTSKIDTLSVDFYNRIEQYSANPYISYYHNNFYFNTGVTFINVDLNNKNQSTKDEVNNTYQRVLPGLVSSYYNERVGYFSLRANKSVVFPNSSDLMPVLNLNNNYLRQTGNKELKPQETITYRIYSTFYKLRGFKSLYFSATQSYSDNAKILINEINNEGVVVQKPVNESGKKDFNFYTGISKKLGKKFAFNIHVSNSKGQNPTYVNTVKAFNKTDNWYLRPGLSYVLSDSFEAGFDLDLSRQDFKNNLNEALNYHQVTIGYEFNLRGLLKTGTEISSSISINDQRSVPGIGKIITVWNLYAQQPLGKKGKYNLKLTAYDILKQNTAISRGSYDNYVTTSQNNQLTQYFMLSLVYKIKKMGGEDAVPDYVY